MQGGALPDIYGLMNSSNEVAERICQGLGIYGSDEDNPYDDQGNWHGRGRELYRGPVAAPGE